MNTVKTHASYMAKAHSVTIMASTYAKMQISVIHSLRQKTTSVLEIDNSHLVDCQRSHGI